MSSRPVLLGFFCFSPSARSCHHRQPPYRRASLTPLAWILLAHLAWVHAVVQRLVHSRTHMFKSTHWRQAGPTVDSPLSILGRLCRMGICWLLALAASRNCCSVQVDSFSPEFSLDCHANQSELIKRMHASREVPPALTLQERATGDTCLCMGDCCIRARWYL
jgi:hypothetical protein